MGTFSFVFAPLALLLLVLTLGGAAEAAAGALLNPLDLEAQIVAHRIEHPAVNSSAAAPAAAAAAAAAGGGAGARPAIDATPVVPLTKEKILQTYKLTLECIAKTSKFIDRKKVEQGFYQPPEDAEEHYRLLIDKTKAFRDIAPHYVQDFKGPWIENLFIRDYLSAPLQLFAGLIPLFVQHVDIHVHSFMGERNHSIPTLVDLEGNLSQLLRPSVLYLVVSQDDQGIYESMASRFPNILVLSAGGYGAVPIPLIKGEFPFVAPPQQWSRSVAFYGTVTSPQRKQILEQAKYEAHQFGASHHFGPSHQWPQEIAVSKFNLAPRGFGRTSYRLSEIIQIGRIPVYLFDDYKWVPYAKSNISVDNFGFVTDKNGIGSTFRGMKAMKDEEFARRMRAVEAAREYYTYPGLLRQLGLFFLDPFGPASLLSCNDQAMDRDHR